MEVQELREDLIRIDDRVREIERHTVEQKTQLGEHIKQERTIYNDVKQLGKDTSEIKTFHYKINERLQDYNDQLKIHIEGVQQLKAMNEKFDVRLTYLERPLVWWKSTKKLAVVLWSIGTTVVALYFSYKAL